MFLLPATAAPRLPLTAVSALRRQARVLDGHAHREVIQRLPRVPGQPEHLVHRIVIEAADARAAGAGGFGLEVQHLTDEATFPEQPAIEPVAVRTQRGFEPREHPETEEPIAG